VTKKKKTTEADKGFLSRLGPGLITGASDDDPSEIGTYSQAGAQLGFGIGWTMLLTYPLMVAIQEISARIGRVTGHGIAGNVCRTFRLRSSGRWCFCCSSPTRSTWRPTSARWRIQSIS
jgi:Mn2+/Fe2+ NRAMP family transporter